MLAVRAFLVRGLLAGLLAGCVAWAVAYVVGEPSLNAAIAVEESGVGHSHDSSPDGSPAAGDEHGDGSPAVVSRSLQSTLGLLTATTAIGVTLGGLVGVLSALALGRFGPLGPRATTLLVAGFGFMALYAVPFAAYPPNPPAVGQADTIGYRTAAYFLFLAMSLVGAVTAVLVGRYAAARIGAWYASLAAGAAYVLAMAVATSLTPSFDEVPSGFPATVLYEFRVASFLTQLTLWAVLGIALAELVHRGVRPARPRRQRDLVLH